MISAVYCSTFFVYAFPVSVAHIPPVLSLRSFARRRVEFSQFLSSNTSLTVGRYFRLMGLAMTEICATTPLAIFIIWLNATASPIGPWISWEDTHFAYSRVEQISATTWRSNHLLVVAIELSRWLNPLCAFTFFAFFGFAQESKRNYRLAWRWIRKSVGFPSQTSRSDIKPMCVYTSGIVFSTLTTFCTCRLSSKLPSSPVSARIPTFGAPSHHGLKRMDTINSTLSGHFSDKESYFDSYPPTPQSPTVMAPSPPSYRLFMNVPSSPKSDKVSLTRSRTL